MKRTLAVGISLFSFIASAMAQESMKMTGMENSVGYLSSGTSIEPRRTSESSPMVHKTLGDWDFMFHGNAFLADIQQSGPRGGDKFFSTNWVMPMFARTFGSSTVTFRTMLSLEPATVTKRRYPLLFQTGESAFGKHIVDGQHPHELFMELSARYDYAFNDRTQFFIYGGPVGEPALGPTAFPHRASASEIPSSPIGHHNQDSTHISNSVITLGFVGGPVQLEASTFHGEEPNENRWNIDTGAPDSFASRLTFSAGQFTHRAILHGANQQQGAFRARIGHAAYNSFAAPQHPLFDRSRGVEYHLGKKQGYRSGRATHLQCIHARIDGQLRQELGMDAHRKCRSRRNVAGRRDRGSCRRNTDRTRPGMDVRL